MAFELSNVAITIVTSIATCAFGAFLANRLSLAKSDHEDRRAKIDEAATCLAEIQSLTDEYTSRCVNFINYQAAASPTVSRELSKEDCEFLSNTRLTVTAKTSRLLFLAENYIKFSEFYRHEILACSHFWNETGMQFEDSIVHGERDLEHDHRRYLGDSRESLMKALIPLEKLIHRCCRAS